MKVPQPVAVEKRAATLAKRGEVSRWDGSVSTGSCVSEGDHCVAGVFAGVWSFQLHSSVWGVGWRGMEKKGVGVGGEPATCQAWGSLMLQSGQA